MVEKIDEYTHYLTLGVCGVLIFVAILLAVEIIIGVLTAISLGG